MDRSMVTEASIISELLASYATLNPEAFASPVAPAAPRMVRVKGKGKAAKSNATPSVAPPTSQGATDPRPAVTFAPLPQKGTLDARSFLQAMGRSKDRQDRILAIAGFIGFDRHGDYSSQELAANLAANRQTRGAPLPLPRPVHTAPPVTTGFVSGLPDGLTKRIGNLEGRITLAVETACDLRKQGAEHLTRGDMANAKRCELLAQVEDARADEIRAELAKAEAL